MKKAQLSTFIIIGMVILAVAGFSFYITQSVKFKKLEAESQEIVEKLKTSPIDNYVKLCLKNEITRELGLIGRNGGYVILPQENVASYDGKRVSVILKNISFSDKYPLPPAYPWNKTKIEDIRFYPFGDKNLVSLCQLGGPNQLTPEEFRQFAYPCPSGSYGLNSIQQNVANYGKITVKNCIDEEYIRNVTGFNITVQEIELTMILGREDITTIAKIPVEIKLPGYEPTKIIDFQQRIPIRLKRIYGLVNFLIDKDRMDLNFDILKDYDSDKYKSLDYDRFIEVEAVEKNNDYDIFRITDNASITKGRPYEFYFARANRNPVLDYVHDVGYEGYADYDLVFKEGETFEWTFTSVDPDEDTVDFDFSGWELIENFDRSNTNEVRVSFSLEDENPGPEEFIVKVTDDGGLEDYQIVKVYIVAEDKDLEQKANIDVSTEDTTTKVIVSKNGDRCEFTCSLDIDNCLSELKKSDCEKFGVNDEIIEKLNQLLTDKGIETKSNLMNYFEITEKISQLTDKDITLNWTYYSDDGTATITSITQTNTIPKTARNDLFQYIETETPEGYELKITTNLKCDDDITKGKDEMCVGGYDGMCKQFPQGEFLSYEMIYGDATGICNKELKPSFGTKYDETNGGFACNAKCGSGLCNKAVNCKCNSTITNKNANCDGLTYEKFQEKGLVPVNGGYCYGKCLYTTNLDTTPGACTAGGYKYATGNSKCCGDDVGEKFENNYCVDLKECVLSDGTFLENLGLSPNKKYFCKDGEKYDCVTPANKCDVVTYYIKDNQGNNILVGRYCKLFTNQFSGRTETVWSEQMPYGEIDC